MRRGDAAGCGLSVSRDEERTLPASRRAEYGAEDGGRDGAHPAGRDEARAPLEAGKGGASGVPGTLAGLPGDAGEPVMKRRGLPTLKGF